LVFGITAALIAAAVLGMWFTSTRVLSITSVAILVFIFPWLVVLVLIGSAAAFYVFRLKPK
jgi:hypothetical protein